MITKEEYEKIGETLKGEAVYRSRKNGCICTEKNHSYLVLSTLREIEEAGGAVIEDSFRNTQIWVPTTGNHHGRKIFRCSKDGRLAIRTGKNRMKIIETPIGINIEEAGAVVATLTGRNKDAATADIRERIHTLVKRSSK